MLISGTLQQNSSKQVLNIPQFWSFRNKFKYCTRQCAFLPRTLFQKFAQCRLQNASINTSLTRETNSRWFYCSRDKRPCFTGQHAHSLKMAHVFFLCANLFVMEEQEKTNIQIVNIKMCLYFYDLLALIGKDPNSKADVNLKGKLCVFSRNGSQHLFFPSLQRLIVIDN